MSGTPRESSKEAAFPWFSLPQELQNLVLENCDNDSLANLCRQRKFLLACDSLLEDETKHGQSLLSSVRVLRLINTPGLAIPYANADNQSWIMFLSGGKRNLIEIISSFKGLEELQLYVKESLDHDPSDRSKHMAMGSALQNQFPSLKKLVMGGEIPRPVVLALLSFPERLENLSCISLLDGAAGQDQHSGALLFLYRMQDRFTHLRQLHLCKMAELTEEIFPHETVQSGLRWNFDYENDEEVLEEWADLFVHISSTLEELELEHCYLVYHRLFDPSRLVHSGEDEPEEWGESSSERFKEIVLPAITEQDWKMLRNLRLVGVMAKSSIGNTLLKDFNSNVKIDCLPARTMRFTDDATPIAISPPNGLFTHTKT